MTRHEDTYTCNDSPSLRNESRQLTPSGWAQTPEYAPSIQASRVGTIGSRRFTYMPPNTAMKTQAMTSYLTRLNEANLGVLTKSSRASPTPSAIYRHKQTLAPLRNEAQTTVGKPRTKKKRHGAVSLQRNSKVPKMKMNFQRKNYGNSF